MRSSSVNPDRISLRVPPDQVGAAVSYLLGVVTVDDLNIEDPPIEDLIVRVFAEAAEDPSVSTGGLMGLGRYYLAEARNGLVSEFQYGVAAAIALLGFLIEPVIYLAVWRTVALAQGGEVGGYDANDFTAYYIVWSLVRVMNLALTPYSWEWRIRGGRLNEFLIRPVHPFHRDFAFFAGQKPVWIAIWVPMAIILWITYRPEVELTIARSLVFFVSIWAAFVIRHMYLFTLGALNFWTTRTSALFELSIAVELLSVGATGPALADARLGPAAFALPARIGGRSCSRSKR